MTPTCLLFRTLLLLCLLLPPCLCVSPVVVSGRRLVDSSTRRRFLVQGSGYDYDVSNANRAQWRPALNALLTAAPHLNTIRLYEVDPSHAYDEFMLDMNRRGVYVIVPLTPSRGWCTLSHRRRRTPNTLSTQRLHAGASLI